MNLERNEANGCPWLRRATGILGTTGLTSVILPFTRHMSPGLRATAHGVLSVADQSGSASARDVWQFGIGSDRERLLCGASVKHRGHLHIPCGEFHGVNHLRRILEEAEVMVEDTLAVWRRISMFITKPT